MTLPLKSERKKILINELFVHGMQLFFPFQDISILDVYLQLGQMYSREPKEELLRRSRY